MVYLFTNALELHRHTEPITPTQSTGKDMKMSCPTQHSINLATASLLVTFAYGELHYEVGGNIKDRTVYP